MQVTAKPNSENNQGMNFSQLWLRHIVYWPFFLLLFILSIAAAWLYLLYKVPVYEANARILIKDESKGAEDSKAMDFLSMISTKKVLENEKEVIASKTLVYEVVKNLSLFAPIYEEGKFKPVSAYITSPVKIEVKNPDMVKNSEEIYFTYNENNASTIIDNKEYPLNKWLTINKDTFRFVKNPGYKATTNKEYFFTFISPKIISEIIKGGLEVTTTSKSSTILNLQYKDEVPQRAEDILNELMKAYNKASLRDKNALASNTLTFVQGRLDKVSKNLDSVENKMKVYKTSSGAIDISTQGGLFLKNVSDNDQKLSEINMKLAVLDQVEYYVASKDNKAGIVPSTLGVDDPMLTRLIGLLYEAELNYEKLKTTEGQNSASLQSITTQIEKIRPGILENIQNQRNSLEASRRNLQTTNNNYSSVLRSIPKKEKDLLDINRERSIISDIYTFLLQKREESVLSYASTVPNSSIVDRAESSIYPVSPKPVKIYLVAFLLPFIIGIGTITIKETFNAKILFRHEIEEITAYPIIGEIAYDKTKDPIAVSKNSRSFISEQFRQLRVALSHNKNKQECNRILITSTISGEGKSYVALNLASMFAMNDKKTVLLELDLNNPSISKNANITSTPGISEYLQGKREKEEIIKRTSIAENLFIIPAGSLPENHPSELLENGKIYELLNYLSEIFDYIIIDTAPVSAITDAYILSSSCHITLYVIRHNYTPKVYIERLDQNNQLNNIAIVFNGIRPRGFGKHHYGYGYGYGYVYNEKLRARAAKA
jgi:tyrosine-protein kinase Etk/Wzc